MALTKTQMFHLLKAILTIEKTDYIFMNEFCAKHDIHMKISIFRDISRGYFRTGFELAG